MSCIINKYVGKKEALTILGLSPMTLLKLEKLNKIEVIKTTGGHRKYNVQKYIDDNKKESEPLEKKETNIKNKLNICYVRVSTQSQKDDLERQKQYMKSKYKNYEIIEDIGSGINFNRKRFKKNNKIRY